MAWRRSDRTEADLTFQPNDEEPKREIVGVVADTIPFRGASEVPPLIYVLHRQQAAQQRSTLEARRTVMSFVVRTNGDPLALGDAVRDAVAKIDPTSAVASIRTVQSYLDAGQTVLFQFIAALLGIFALVAVVMSAVGTSALAAFNVAHGRGVIASMLGALMAVAVGGAAGLYAWRQLASTIASFLTNLRVTPSDPQPLIVTGVVLLVTALVACLMPSLRRRATR